jgi:hypothetical protein
MRRLLLILIVGLLGVFAATAQDNELVADEPPYPCPYTNGAFYQPNVFPRYDINSKSLVLVDAATNQTVRALDTFDENVRIINWSPDCRYLSGAVGSIRSGGKAEWVPGGYYVSWYHKNVVVWDAVNSGRVWSVISPYKYLDYPHRGGVLWSPDSNYALVLGGCGSVRRSCIYERVRYDWIWQRNTYTAVRVGQLPEPPSITTSNGEIFTYYYENVSRSWFNQVYWDTKRGWLWGSGAGGVSAYDVNTGVEVWFLQNGSWPESRFIFSADNAKVVVYSIADSGFNKAAITLFDTDNQGRISVNVEGFSAPEIPLASYHPVALSADNRYLVVGHEALRVWDVQNLPENVADRLPIYRHGGPKALIQSVRFADWGVIETTSAEGVQHWDLHTGEFIPG